MKKIIHKIAKRLSKSKSSKKLDTKLSQRKSVKRIEKENKSTKNSRLRASNREQNNQSIEKKPKPKASKWKFGIIVKQKPRVQSQGLKNRQKPHRQSVKSCKNMIDKQRITRSIARRLIDRNLLDLDQEYLVFKERPTTNRILNDDVLKLVFGYLPLKDRFRIQRTCKQFYDVVQEMLSEQMALRIGKSQNFKNLPCSFTIIKKPAKLVSKN